jgi:arylsulfatase A-like enzyme
MIPRYQVLPRARRVGDYVRRYDGEIIGTDAQVRRLRRALEVRGLLERTLVVITADHGESLGESDYFFQHGVELNEASLHVPLVLRHPGLPAGARVDAPASLVDVFPTLLSLVGLPPSAGLAGRDLTPFVFGATADERTLVAYNVAGARRVAVRRGPWKLVGRIPLDHTAASDARRLFRVTASNRDEPVALTDQPEVAERLEADLKALGPLATPTATRKRRSEVSSEDRERLRALGYLD